MYHYCIHSRLPEDESSGSKYVEDIKKLKKKYSFRKGELCWFMLYKCTIKQLNVLIYRHNLTNQVTIWNRMCYSHSRTFQLWKFSLSSRNVAQTSLLDNSNINSPFILSMYLLFSPSSLPSDTVRVLCSIPSKFMHFKRVRIVAKRANYILVLSFSYLSVWPHVSAWLPLDRFPRNLILGTFMAVQPEMSN